MKRFLALLLILVLALSGCGAQTPAADGAGTGSPEAGNQTPAQADGKGEIRFTETVVVDNEACLIKLTGIEIVPKEVYDHPYCAVTMQLENRSPDTDYTLYVDAAVDGVMGDCGIEGTNHEFAAGEAGSREMLVFAGLDETNTPLGDFTDIELHFHVSDPYRMDYTGPYAGNIAEETVHIYPYGEDKAASYSRELKSTDTVLLDNDLVTVVLTGCGYTDLAGEGEGGVSGGLYFVNKTDWDVEVNLPTLYVNGNAAFIEQPDCL